MGNGARAAGILKRLTDADRGLVAKPALTPHLEFRRLDDGQALLVSETFNTLLHGPIHCDVLPLLDGKRSQQDIAAALAGAHEAPDVREEFAALAARGYIVSAEHTMERGRAAFWSTLGASPCWAEQRLRDCCVTVHGDDERLVRRIVRQLEASGVRVDVDRPTVAVMICSDYLDVRHADLNRRHIASGTHWMLVRPQGIEPLLGPVFRPAQQGPCWACLAYRMRGHREVHTFLRRALGDGDAFLPCAAEPAVLDGFCGLAASEIAKWLVLDALAPLHEHALSFDAAEWKLARHPTARRPQCLACGADDLYRADRPAVPVRLEPSPKRVRNSGGVRTVPPEDTLARQRHLVSPISGVVTRLGLISDEKDPWLQVYCATFGYATGSRQLTSLRRSLRNNALGKGRTRSQSMASALSEAVERYCGARHGDEIRCLRRLVDFQAASAESDAIHPNDVQLFSDRQLGDAAKLNARGLPRNVVPPRFDPEAETEWSPVWSLTEQRHRYLPTSVLYSAPAELRGRSGLAADSNGCAAGNTLEEAILQGFFELVERDAFAIWWYNRLRRPSLDLESFGDDYLATAGGYYRSQNRELWVLDVTTDLGIPVFVAVSRHADRLGGLLFGAGAHLDPRIAALRAVCELNQWLAMFRDLNELDRADPATRAWWRDASVAASPYLLPTESAPPRRKPDYDVPDTTDIRDDVEYCRALVEARGMDFLVLDQTRPDIGMPVARVIVPGLRHFWERFAPGRLYDVPVEMGWRERPLAEAELNPRPVII